MFKDSLAFVQKFVESDDKIRVMWNVGDVVCWECGMLGLWDVGDVGYLGCEMLGMWDIADGAVEDVECWG